MAQTKPTPSAASVIQPANRWRSLLPVAAIVICTAVAHIVFYKVFGNPANFEGGDAAHGHPLNSMGIVFKGGFVIPIGMTLALTMFVFVIERAITLIKATGKGNIDVFVKGLRNQLRKGDVEGAIKACDNNKGSIATVVKAGLRKYQEMEHEGGDKEHRKEAIKTEIEEATALEMPMLERNMIVIASTASLGTLVGLIGTVLGMIRAFSALGAGGAPNAAELSVGISEALVNTALGITTSAVSIFFYNFFNTKIENMVHSMDEAGYSIIETFDMNVE